MSENYWGDILQSNDEKTDGIINIMNEQCRYLSEITNHKVMAVFGEINRTNNYIQSVLKPLFDYSFLNRNSTYAVLQGKEYIGNVTTENKIDAGDMFYSKQYAFEIYTKTYRFRLFELRLTPAYPIDITIDEGVYNDIDEKLFNYKNQNGKNNSIIINSESEFCIVLKILFQNKKVKYVINQMLKRSEEELAIEQRKASNEIRKKIIICEGTTDEIALQAISQKLERSITTVVAGGQHHIPAYFESIKKQYKDSKFLIVADADGDEEGTRSFIEDKIGKNVCNIVIINNNIESMLGIDSNNLNEYKLAQSIIVTIDSLDIESKKKENESFRMIVDFILE